MNAFVNGMAKKANIIMLIVYGIAILTCYICNRAIEGALSWFYIVVCSLALSFSIINIPLIVKKNRLLIAAICASFMVYVLLLVCNWYVKGGWLFNFAYPVATISLFCVWSIILVCRSNRMNRLLKSVFISLVFGLFSLIINPLVNYLMNEPVNLYNHIRLDYWSLDSVGNKIAFLCCMFYCIAGFSIYLLKKRIRQ